MTYTKRTVSVILIVIISFSVFFTPSFESAEQFTVTDTNSGQVFTITVNDNEVCIPYLGTEHRFFIDTEITDICCYDGTFTFLCILESTQNNYTYNIYTYDTKNQNLTSYATDCKADRNNDVFTADGKRNVYIRDGYDQTLLHQYSNGQSYGVISCSSQIKQLMCVNCEDVLLFTVDGVYLLVESTPVKVYDFVPVSPCTYSSGGIITDNTGVRYIYNNGSFELFIEDYGNKEITVDFENKQLLMQQGQTFAKLYNFLWLTKSELTVTKQDGSYITEGRLGTGMTASFKGMVYKIIVFGDLTGEGNVNSRDLKALMEHLSGKAPLIGIYFTAADLDKDGSLTTMDLLALSKLY